MEVEGGGGKRTERMKAGTKKERWRKERERDEEGKGGGRK